MWGGYSLFLDQALSIDTRGGIAHMCLDMNE